jgi:hypothetical protein
LREAAFGKSSETRPAGPAQADVFRARSPHFARLIQRLLMNLLIRRLAWPSLAAAARVRSAGSGAGEEGRLELVCGRRKELRLLSVLLFYFIFSVGVVGLEVKL